MMSTFYLLIQISYKYFLFTLVKLKLVSWKFNYFTSTFSYLPLFSTSYCLVYETLSTQYLIFLKGKKRNVIYQLIKLLLSLSCLGFQTHKNNASSGFVHILSTHFACHLCNLCSYAKPK